MKLAIIKINRGFVIHYIKKEFETYNDAKSHAEKLCNGYPYEIEFYDK